MTKLIKNWEELAKVPANDKYRIIVDEELCSGWIVPVWDESDMNGYDDFICNCKPGMTAKHYCDKHVYLGTHTFYRTQHEYSTRVLQEHGFDIEIDNWDK